MTLQQIPERRPKKIDLNLLPPEFRPAKKTRFDILIIIVTILLLCATVVLVILKTGIDGDIGDLQKDLNAAQSELSELNARKTAANAVQQQIDAVEQDMASMQTNYETFLNERMLWSEIVTEIDDLLPGTKITLDSITLVEDTVHIDGTSLKKIYVYDYVIDLEENNFFEDVDFTFGDCPDATECEFSIVAPLSEAPAAEGEYNE